MHTKEFDDYIITHNGDYSGDAIITNKNTDDRFEIPCSILFDFTGEYIRDKMISELESEAGITVLRHFILQCDKPE